MKALDIPLLCSPKPVAAWSQGYVVLNTGVQYSAKGSALKKCHLQRINLFCPDIV